MGPGFLAKFKEIGEGVRTASGGEIRREDLEASALAVESETLCPYCPDPPMAAEEDAAMACTGFGCQRLPQAQLPA